MSAIGYEHLHVLNGLFTKETSPRRWNTRVVVDKVAVEKHAGPEFSLAYNTFCASRNGC